MTATYTTVYVAGIDWAPLAEEAFRDRPGWSMKPAEILAAYNAAQGVR